METEEIIIVAKNFYYTYTAVSIIFMVGLVAFMFFKPKAAAKTLGAVAVFLLLIYWFSMLGKSSSVGMGNKDRMINQTIEKNM